MTEEEHPTTANDGYTERMLAAEAVWWKRALDVRAPYRWNLRRLGLGRTLDVGCGIGRNLIELPEGSVGVDHNERSVAVARERGCTACTPEAFETSSLAAPESFDGLLFAHVLEHMTRTEAHRLVGRYARWLRPGGVAVFITPQEAGFRSDPTHVEYLGLRDLASIAARNGFTVLRSFSFPFPKWVGRWFPYNENVLVAQRRAKSAAP